MHSYITIRHAYSAWPNRCHVVVFSGAKCRRRLLVAAGEQEEIGQVQGWCSSSRFPSLKVLPRSGNLCVTGGLCALLLGPRQRHLHLTSNHGYFLLVACCYQERSLAGSTL